MTHLKVCVRVRPLSPREIENDSKAILNVEKDGKTIAITNVKVFQAVEKILEKSIKSQNHSCVLAYGQSSSGKTHTMMGFPHDPGLTPRLCRQIFGYLDEDTKVTISYLEIYNEKVRDLFGSNAKFALKIRQHPRKGPYVEGLTEHSVTDSSTLLQLLTQGNNNRRVASTLTNSHSSRSHSVFIVTFNTIKLTLVDLAGSERAGNSTSRFREGANINKSLVALGNVITALAQASTKCVRRRFIPYRDSVLTWLLKDILGGNSDTLMIATISPASSCYTETINTLRFGQRAKLIVSLPVVNEDPKEKTIRELRIEIARLKELLKNQTPSQQLPEMEGGPSKRSSIDKGRKVEAKVDSIRRIPPKPRAQIVAAVTHRLYAKTKQKEASTDTSDLPPPVSTPTRSKLQELTRKALRAHRSRNKETQTDPLHVTRVKNIATDVEDLKVELFEMRHAYTSTDEGLTEDKEVNCAILASFRNVFVVTRSCGTQAPSSTFSKYLQEPSPRWEFCNPHTANPIYTNTVNINIHHNYNQGPKGTDSISDDSLEDAANVCFPTPDLISNHNSLEPKEAKLLHASPATFDPPPLEEALDFHETIPKTHFARLSTVPNVLNRLDHIDIPAINAAQICAPPLDSYRCRHFTTPRVAMAKAAIVEPKWLSDDCVTLSEPQVLKSIMKNPPETPLKKVHFGGGEEGRMMRAMSGFLEEATVLMNNLSMANLDLDREYDLEVSISGLEQKRKRKRKVLKDEFCQTETCENFELPVNKFELLLEDSCRRLEEKIEALSMPVNPWDFNGGEDTSLESNPITFSDYGSLPRRNKRHKSCTPSLYLKQLASLRKQVIEASREELSSDFK